MENNKIYIRDIKKDVSRYGRSHLGGHKTEYEKDGRTNTYNQYHVFKTGDEEHFVIPHPINGQYIVKHSLDSTLKNTYELALKEAQSVKNISKDFNFEIIDESIKGK